MQHDVQALDSDQEFIEWLKNNKFMPYQQALEEEGYEELESLVLLSKEEIEDLSTAIKMRPGHKKKLPVAIQSAREELEELKAKRKKLKQEQEKEQEEKAKKQEREKEEQEKEQELAQQLANISRERKLAKARQLKVADSKDPEDQTAENSKTDTARTESTKLPAWKEFSAFISHKKMHTKFADSSETLSIRLKVILFLLVLPL